MCSLWCTNATAICIICVNAEFMSTSPSVGLALASCYRTQLERNFRKC